ncbi:MAG: hypothetical protein AUJ97_02880 [Bacteroidetes bacterium CG2_30_32_10]|nr:MAG: hypothetical protein AUJ97_02880 [Bacteroidetes bacterium CG2_30_32_10]
MKTFYIIVLIFIISIISEKTNAQKWDWAVGFGGKGLERVWDVKVGNSGNIYITGQYTDTLIVNQHQYPSNGLSDIFLAKFNRNGQLGWVKTYGSKNEDVAIAIGIDALENCYITGYFTDTLQIADTNLIAKGGWDLLIIKTDSAGNYHWARQIQGTAGEVGYGISVTNEGNAYITGWYQDSVMFHNGYIMHNYGSSDILIAKYDTYGNLVWAKHAGTSGIEYGYKICSDEYGNCYVTGIAGVANCNFDGFILDKAGMFVAKYNANGAIQWAIAGEDASVNDISVEKNGNGFVTGRFIKNAIFGNDSITSFNNTDDAYIAHFDNNGNWLWAIDIGNNGSDKGRCIENDINLNAYVGLTYDSTITMNGQTYYTKGAGDILIQKINSMGEPDWGMNAGGKYDDVISDITIDTLGNWIVVGWFSDTCYFGNKTITSSGQSDVNFFIAKISPLSSDILKYNNDDKCRVYPNPANNILNIELKDNQNVPIFFNLFDIYGTETYRSEIISNNFSIDISQIKSGVYFYQIVREKNIYKGKVIILK